MSKILSTKKNCELKAFVFGSGNGDEEYCRSAGWELSSINKADIIIARGTFTINDGTTVVSKKDGEDLYFRHLQDTLKTAALRQVPMIVCNPDKVRPDKGLPPMPGAIGDTYESFLGHNFDPKKNSKDLVKRIGKPFLEVYALAIGDTDPTNAVMVGDALETDITGGELAGCKTCWIVKDGIHSEAIEVANDNHKSNGITTDSLLLFEKSCLKVLEAFNEKKNVTYHSGHGVIKPSYILPHFQW